MSTSSPHPLLILSSTFFFEPHDLEIFFKEYLECRNSSLYWTCDTDPSNCSCLSISVIPKDFPPFWKHIQRIASNYFSPRLNSDSVSNFENVYDPLKQLIMHVNFGFEIQKRLLSSSNYKSLSWCFHGFDLESYISLWYSQQSSLFQMQSLPQSSQESLRPLPIVQRAYARVGLMGNPSDGFYGKTISLLIGNYFAEVTLTPNRDPLNSSISIIPNPLSDPMSFPNIETISLIVRKDGYYGGHRLILAVIKVFSEACLKKNLDLGKTGFTIQYRTHIPR